MIKNCANFPANMGFVRILALISKFLRESARKLRAFARFLAQFSRKFRADLRNFRAKARNFAHFRAQFAQNFRYKGQNTHESHISRCRTSQFRRKNFACEKSLSRLRNPLYLYYLRVPYENLRDIYEFPTRYLRVPYEILRDYLQHFKVVDCRRFLSTRFYDL